MNAEDDPIAAVVEFDEIARAEEAWFERWRPRYQPPDAPPPPTDVDHAWVYEDGLEDGFEDYVTGWRRDLLARTLDVEKRERDLAYREYINAERKQRGERDLPRTRRMRKMIEEHAAKGVEAEDFRLRNAMSGGIISPIDLLPIAEGFVGVQADAIEAYVDQILGGGHQPLIPDSAQGQDG